jgi:hypothetical protein
MENGVGIATKTNSDVGTSPTSSNSKDRTMAASAVVASERASWRPGQTRVPPPNGSRVMKADIAAGKQLLVRIQVVKAKRLFAQSAVSFGSLQRSGRNALGSSKS